MRGVPTSKGDDSKGPLLIAVKALTVAAACITFDAEPSSPTLYKEYDAPGTSPPPCPPRPAVAWCWAIVDVPI